MNEMDEILGEFLAESYEHLDRFDEALHELGESPTTVVPDLYRTLHTFKGTCGFFELRKLETVAHAAEALLSKVRDGEAPLDAGAVSALLRGAAAMRSLLDQVRSDGAEGDVDVSAAVAALEAPGHGERRGIGEILGGRVASAAEVFSALSASHRSTPVAPEPSTAAPVPRLGDLLILTGLVTSGQVEAAIAAQRAGDARHLGEILVAHGVVDAADVFEALNAQSNARAGVIGDPTVRVDVRVLDDLLDVITGLAEVCDEVQRSAAADVDSPLSHTARRLVQITGRLQQGVMRTRMQPIGVVFEKVPRAVRTLEAQCGKQAIVHVSGAELEVDRTVIEAVKGPLTHLVRNAVDHGIETPDARVAAGKPPAGEISLRAFAQDSMARVQVSDDGAGIDVVNLRRRAVEMGVATAAEVAAYSDDEALQLIFRTGLSTASEVSTVSGRGVGMDAIRASVTELGGSIEVTTRPGVGTTFTLSFPPSLAMLPALIVADGAGRFAVPRRDIVEVFALPAQCDAVRATIPWRDGELPLVRVGRAGGPRPSDVVVVVQSRDGCFGLLVDDVLDAEDVVVKPDDVAGAAARPVVTADGSLAAVVDADRLAPARVPAGAGTERP